MYGIVYSTWPTLKNILEWQSTRLTPVSKSLPMSSTAKSLTDRSVATRVCWLLTLLTLNMLTLLTLTAEAVSAQAHCVICRLAASSTRMMPLSGLQICLWPCVTLTFHYTGQEYLLPHVTWPLTSWPIKLIVSCFCSVDHLCQLASELLHWFPEYCIHKFGDRRTDRRTSVQPENIKLSPACLSGMT